jgi:conjugative transposon TraJ protein
MKTTLKRAAILAVLATLLPYCSMAQGVASDLHSLQGVLSNLYAQMMPMCSGLINVSRGIAGFAALFYIGSRIWKHQAAAEPIDIYPLLRPFAIGFCILVFPLVLTLINGILQPTVDATDAMVNNTNQAIQKLTSGQTTGTDSGVGSGNADPDKYYQYAHPDNSGGGDGSNSNPIADAFSGWGLKNMVRRWIAELLNILFEAAALCLDTIRTFKLIVLAILGPLCFGLSVFDGFQHTLKQWLARYVNVFMWLPVANIFGAIIAKIQVMMIISAQTGNLQGNEFGNTNTAYLIFLLIGILGYACVPGIANYIMNVGGHALFNRTSAIASMAVSYASGTIMQSLTGGKTSSGSSASTAAASGGNTQTEKLSGNSSTKTNLP